MEFLPEDSPNRYDPSSNKNQLREIWIVKYDEETYYVAKGLSDRKIKRRDIISACSKCYNYYDTYDRAVSVALEKQEELKQNGNWCVIKVFDLTNY